jgi:ADP-dependent NAD(P)H-hydrate dehydratase / NAD(P)H-hydrate epimerase
MRILNTEQMREADRQTIEEVGIPSLVLMENAGRQVVAAMEAAFPDLLERRIAVLCGKGNNGGDGFVVARSLSQRGVDVSVFVVGTVSEIRGDARTNLEILGRLGVTVVEIADEGQWELHFSEISDHELVVDALFGTGLRSPLSGLYETAVADLNASDLPVVSIDLPSGLSADSSDLIGECVDATLTVTLAAPKLPLILPPAEVRAGEVVIADIGIPPGIIEALEGSRLELLTREQIRPLLSPRPVDVHKGDFGRVLIVGGSRGKSGAAVLAALGALRAGAGLVTVATPQSVAPVVAAHAPEYMTEWLEETSEGLLDARAADRVLALQADVMALGPGLGQGASVRAFVRHVFDGGETPLVLDADALNAFAGDAAALRGREGRDVIITPHPGEMARLVGCSVEDVQANRVGIARDFAEAHRVYVVLKGYRTLIATPDGGVFVNPTGSPGMATGGTGDVLAGMLAAWLAQLLDAEAACRLAVYVHGAAGELADADHGEVSMTATDLVHHISDAVLELTARRRVVQSKADGETT